MQTPRRRRATWVAVLGACLALVAAACSDSDTVSGDATSGSAEPVQADDAVADTSEPETTEPETTTTEADSTTSSVDEGPAEEAPADDGPTAGRPYDVFVPSGYDAADPMPLVLLLHGYTASGAVQEAYFGFESLAESRGFLYVHPDGTMDASGARFWNATDACCGFGVDPPDDAAYLMGIIEEVSADFSVDPKAIFLAGHSNGGFMSYRMACDHADTIAGVASLAGATFSDAADCEPSEPVSVLQVHGTNDDTILYDGGAILGSDYPGARETVETWVAHNSCEATPALTPDVLDLDSSIDGLESDTEVFAGCDRGSQVELWTIDSGSHIPRVTDDFSAGVVDFLLAHPKP